MEALDGWWPGIATLAGLLLVIVAWALFRQRREARDRAVLAGAVAHNLHLPPSLHPEIDPDICIGSLSCLRACPEGDILGVVNGAARLIRGANCIGHGRCALECPVGAIKLVFGTSERGVELPELDTRFESSRPGVHVAGELGGMGLIRNAVTQGLELAEVLGRERGPVPEGGVDVAIVGSGPAGLATALACRKAGLTVRVLEQDSLGGTIAHFPRQKIVMTEPVDLPFYGRLPDRTLSKEDVLGAWKKAIAKAGLRVEEATRVVGLAGKDGEFALQTDQGTVAARRVVLATGRRGTPRKLGVSGEEGEKVAYRLTDPEQYAGTRVLVVGGGDSAVEAALALSQEKGTEVTLSYRGEALARCREANRLRFEQQVAAGRIRAMMSSQVTHVGAHEVSLTTPQGPSTLENDFLIVLIGGELPLEFLQKMGVSVKRFHGETPKARGSTPGVREDRTRAEERRRRRLAVGLGLLGLTITAFLAYKGWDYYLLPGIQRLRAAAHGSLKPSGLWGHGVGVVATAFMLSNFLYPVRKRLGLLKGRAPIRTWLTFHMFVGFMSPLVILFHGAFQVNNQLAAGTLLALVVVVGTGIVGRFVYGLIPAEHGAVLEESEVLAALERARGQIEDAVSGTGDAEAARAALASLDHASGSFFAALVRLATVRLRLAGKLRSFRSRIDAGHFDELRRAARAVARLRVQAQFLKSFKHLLTGWRLFHATLAAFLVVAIAAHIGVSIFLGYRWILP
jgi:putative YpdA family bacillithiol system oxidoreductase